MSLLISRSFSFSGKGGKLLHDYPYLLNHKLQRRSRILMLVFLYSIADIERAPRVYVLEVGGHIECYAVDYTA